LRLDIKIIFIWVESGNDLVNLVYLCRKMSTSSIRIGTRDSQLAIWQAELLQQLLKGIGVNSELVHIKTAGDLNTSSHLHAMNTIGVFTKALDDALLAKQIDVAVHSCKDMPTVLSEGLFLGAYLERDEPEDVLVLPAGKDKIVEEDLNTVQTLGTGSLRRTAQWLYRYPHHKVENLRGNVNTRLRKLNESGWLGAIFSKSGLSRLGILPENAITLDWMVPAPAQGVVAIVCRSGEEETIDMLSGINHKDSAMTSTVERAFMNVLEGGCSAPIGAYAVLNGDKINFHGTLHSPEGTEKIEVKRHVSLSALDHLGEDAAREILDRGGAKIIEQIKTI
jgi:hydroxymethylbilane synthase